jgi:uncharacterized protein
VTPRAGRDTIVGYRGNVLLVRVAAPPVEGAANDALVALLAASLDVPRRDVRVMSGNHSRQKRVAVHGVSAAALNDRLTRLLNSRSGAGRL